MKNREIIKYSMEGLRYRKLRSWLTILGVVIGIASIVVLIALAQGLDRSVREQIEGFGTNFMQVFPGKPFSSGSFGPPVFKGALYESDTDSLRRLPGIQGISSLISPGFVRYEYKNSTYTAILTGIEPEAFQQYVDDTGMEKGEFIRSVDKNLIVVGNVVAKTAFKDKVEVGKIIYINGEPYRVKGIINPSASFDTDIYVTTTAAKKFVSSTEDPDRIFGIFIITDPERELKPIAEQVERIIANNHRVKLEDKDFSVITAQTILDSIGIIFGLLSIFLGMVAGISLLVGSIGIANSMYTSVMERTREIGILKSVGAENKTIVRIFLAEAAIIGMVGGLIGVLVGYSLSAAINYAGFPTQVSIELASFALLISIAVGLVSGYFPAKKGASMEPVEALRYE
ncbi:ABC transporter permease [Candidatus Micrarchaeota archaeon]|nr:ABC transporter permease [Candidatus Micrarchaeota archaeon]